MGPDAVNHVAANDLVNEPSHLAKEIPVFENPLPKTHFLREAKDQVTVSDLGESLEKVHRGRFRLACYATRTDAGLAGERDRHTDVAGLALEQSYPEIGVAALFEFEERLLHFPAERPVGTLVATLVDGEKRVEMIRENGPERALESLTRAVLARSAWKLEDRSESDGQDT